MSDPIFTRKKKSSFWVVVPLILLPVYLFFFPYLLGRESVVRPVWAMDLRRPPPTAGTSGEGAFPFRAGERFGYATPDGRLVYSEAVRYRVTLSERGFINYGSRPDHVVLMDPTGSFQEGLRIFGYPILASSGEALYSVDTDLGGIKRLGFDGEVLWQAEFSSPVTAVDVRAQRSLVGLLDGRALLFDADGGLRSEIDPPGSRIPVILAAALAPTDGFALVSGIDPQTLVLVRGEDLQTVRSLPLSSDFRREVLLRFGPSGRFLYLEQEDALEVMEPLRERTARLELPGRLTSFAAGPRFAVAASSRGDTASLVVFRPMASAVARAAPARQVAWSMVSGTSLFVGLEDRLFRADVMEE